MKGVTEETSRVNIRERSPVFFFFFYFAEVVKRQTDLKGVRACFNFISGKSGEITLLSFSFTREA